MTTTAIQLTDSQKLNIRPDERFSVFGHTRAGKSTAMRHMAWLFALQAEKVHSPHYQEFILWTKQERTPLFTPRHFPGTTVAVVHSVNDILKPRARVIICQVPYHEKNVGGYERFYSQIYWRSETTKWPATVWTDESNAVTEYKANGGPPSFKRCYTEGGGLGLGMGSGVQDPVFIQREMISQADHLFIWRVQKSADRKLLSDEIGVPIPRWYPDKRGFYYFRSDMEPIYFPDIQTATGWEVVM